MLSTLGFFILKKFLCVFISWFLNSFIEAWFTYHEIHLFWVHSSLNHEIHLFWVDSSLISSKLQIVWPLSQCKCETFPLPPKVISCPFVLTLHPTPGTTMNVCLYFWDHATFQPQCTQPSPGGETEAWVTSKGLSWNLMQVLLTPEFMAFPRSASRGQEWPLTGQVRRWR